jgi:HEAT repeat protein
MMPMRRESLLLAPFVLAACASTRDVRDDADPSPWVRPNPLLAQQIEDEAARLPYTHGFDRLEQIRWFAQIGEVAYPVLLRLAVDERDDVAAAALAALGATLDSRLVQPIQSLAWSEERLAGDLGLERARTLVRLGDWSAMPVLIRGLRDERPLTRSLCLDALREATHETHGFDPRSEPGARELALKRWEHWWLQRTGEGILPRE